MDDTFFVQIRKRNQDLASDENDETLLDGMFGMCFHLVIRVAKDKARGATRQ
jgi:hypothetical protein